MDQLVTEYVAAELNGHQEHLTVSEYAASRIVDDGCTQLVATDTDYWTAITWFGTLNTNCEASLPAVARLVVDSVHTID